MKKIFLLAACSITIFSTLAQTTETAVSDYAPKKVVALGHYFSLAYENESGGGPRNGFSLGYMIGPGAKRKYYIGANASVLVGSKTESYMEYTLSALSANLTQRVFLGTRAKVSPFLDFNLGYRIISNSAQIPMNYGAIAPSYFGTLGARYYTGGERTESKEMNAVTGYIGAGCFLNILKGCGMFVTLGLRVTDKFELIDKDSVGKTANHTTPDYELGYDTYFTKPAFVTFSVGFLVGKKR